MFNCIFSIIITQLTLYIYHYKVIITRLYIARLSLQGYHYTVIITQLLLYSYYCTIIIKQLSNNKYCGNEKGLQVKGEWESGRVGSRERG